MGASQQYRITRQVPLIRLETFCCSVQSTLIGQYPSVDLPRIWRLYISADCPRCGLRVCGSELRALAFAPCIELASAKTGRMRLGDCARQGCEAWLYDVHFWHTDEIDWSSLLEVAERPDQNACTAKPLRPSWLVDLAHMAAARALGAAAILGLVSVLLLAREYYLGGRIPFLREPENFTIDSTTLDSAWPEPMDGDGRINR